MLLQVLLYVEMSDLEICWQRMYFTILLHLHMTLYIAGESLTDKNKNGPTGKLTGDLSYIDWRSK